jgi:hypothetical protein
MTSSFALVFVELSNARYQDIEAKLLQGCATDVDAAKGAGGLDLSLSWSIELGA